MPQRPAPVVDRIPYAVPWIVVRDHPPLYGLTNASPEPLKQVWFGLIGPGVLPVERPVSVAPGETAWVTVHGADLSLATMLVVRWRRANGDEYLWRVAF